MTEGNLELSGGGVMFVADCFEQTAGNGGAHISRVSYFETKGYWELAEGQRFLHYFRLKA